MEALEVVSLGTRPEADLKWSLGPKRVRLKNAIASFLEIEPLFLGCRSNRPGAVTAQNWREGRRGNLVDP